MMQEGSADSWPNQQLVKGAPEYSSVRELMREGCIQVVFNSSGNRNQEDSFKVKQNRKKKGKEKE
jgi:hypothetical protein